MGIYFKCPNCGKQIIDWCGECSIDEEGLVFACPYCHTVLSDDDRNDDEYKSDDIKKI